MAQSIQDPRLAFVVDYDDPQVLQRCMHTCMFQQVYPVVRITSCDWLGHIFWYMIIAHVIRGEYHFSAKGKES